MRFKAFNFTKIGSSHLKADKICQDASYSFQDDDCICAVLCDGHGGDDYIRSDIGAKFAVEIASEMILKFLRENSTFDDNIEYPEKLNDLQNDILNEWNAMVVRHWEINGFTNKELSKVSEKYIDDYTDGQRVAPAYGTTLVALGGTKDYCFGIQIGDGSCVFVNVDGEFTQPIPSDSKCFLNSTTSMCDMDAEDNFRNFFSKELPIAMFISTDGVDDCFASSELLYNFYRTIMYSFSTENFETAISELEEYLPRLSAKGSGDDISLGVLIDLDLIGEIDKVKNFDLESEKARVKENERLELERLETEKALVEAKFKEVENSEKN